MTFGEEIEQLFSDVDRKLEELYSSGRTIAQLYTPIDTGFAASQWAIEREASRVRIVNRVEYIEALDGGSSAQAPEGITEPATRTINGAIETIFDV